MVKIPDLLETVAPEVGKQAADITQADCIDREIIAEVAARLHRQEQNVIAKEMPPSSLLGRIVEALLHSYAVGDTLTGAYLPLGEIPLDGTRYLQALKSVVRELARSQPFVIIGRGNQSIPEDYPGVLHISVVAPLEVRVKPL